MGLFLIVHFLCIVRHCTVQQGGRSWGSDAVRKVRASQKWVSAQLKPTLFCPEFKFCHNLCSFDRFQLKPACFCRGTQRFCCKFCKPILIFVQRTMTCIVILNILPQLRILSRIMYNFPDLLQYYITGGGA